MRATDTRMEEHIKDTAKRIFFAEGRFHATPQEIAEAAGVTRTLLNYYFRSKETLFNLVLEQAHRDMEKKLFLIFDSNLPFKKKIEHFIETFLAEHYAYPHVETFLMSQLNGKPDILASIFGKNSERSEKLKSLLVEIEKEMKKGAIQKTHPLQFMINLMSLMAHPPTMRPLLQTMMDISDKEFDRLLQERKEIIMELMFRK